MKKSVKYLVGIGMVVWCLCSCQQQDAEMYVDDPRLFFARGNGGYGQQDSILHSFFMIPEEEGRDTVFVELKTMGFPVDKIRPVKIIQTNNNEANAAIPGTHYIAFDDPEIVDQFAIAPGEVSAKIPIIFLRDKSLETTKVRLVIAISANDYFNPGIDENRNFMVQTTAMADKPANWDSSIFGDWGSKKMWFIVNYVGFTDFDEVISDSAYKDYLKLKVRIKLVEYNQSHAEPLCGNPDKHHAPGETCKDCVLFP